MLRFLLAFCFSSMPLRGLFSCCFPFVYCSRRSFLSLGLSGIEGSSVGRRAGQDKANEGNRYRMEKLGHRYRTDVSSGP